MFARHPLELTKDKLEERDLVEALRLAIVAELDAISFYLQVASRATREDVKRVFEDVAREEKTHVGEFLEMLRRLDPEQARELEAGAREVRELLGEESNPGGGGGEASGGGGESLEELVARIFRRIADETRVLRKKLPVTRLGPGVDHVVVSRVVVGGEGVSVEEEVVTPLHELGVTITIPQRLVERHRRLGEPLDPVLEAAARRLVSLEEKLIVEELLGVTGAHEKQIGSWDKPGEAVEDVAEAVSLLEAEGFRGPFLLLLPPRLYAKLLAVHEKTGAMELIRVRELAEPLRTPHLQEDALLVAAEKSGLDVVIGTDTQVDYLGLEDGVHKFRAWETIALRISNPRAIVKLKPGARS